MNERNMLIDKPYTLEVGRRTSDRSRCWSQGLDRRVAQDERIATMWRSLALLALACTACTAATTGAPPRSPRPGRMTGPEACQPGPGASPAAGHKAFEIFMQKLPGSVAWLELDGKAMGLEGDTLEGCFHVQLGPGQHPITIRGLSGHPGAGSGVAVKINEIGGEEGQWRFDTFQLQCGVPDGCDDEQLIAWKQHTDGLTKHLHDPCGSTKVRRAAWSSARSADSEHTDDFAVSAVLDLYDFQPAAGPGECGQAPGEPAGDEAE
jgi:hypothetical protein